MIFKPRLEQPAFCPRLGPADRAAVHVAGKGDMGRAGDRVVVDASGTVVAHGLVRILGFVATAGHVGAAFDVLDVGHENLVQGGLALHGDTDAADFGQDFFENGHGLFLLGLGVGRPGLCGGKLLHETVPTGPARWKPTAANPGEAVDLRIL